MSSLLLRPYSILVFVATAAASVTILLGHEDGFVGGLLAAAEESSPNKGFTSYPPPLGHFPGADKLSFIRASSTGGREAEQMVISSHRQLADEVHLDDINCILDPQRNDADDDDDADDNNNVPPPSTSRELTKPDTVLTYVTGRLSFWMYNQKAADMDVIQSVVPSLQLIKTYKHFGTATILKTREDAALLKDTSHCYAVFKGTRGTSLGQWLSNANSVSTMMKGHVLPAVKHQLDDKRRDILMYVHSGFYSGYNAFRTDTTLIQDIYDCIMEGSKTPGVPSKTLVLAGHSRGGAMASFTAYDFLFSDGILTGLDLSDRAKYVMVYTYGEPRSLDLGVVLRSNKERVNFLLQTARKFRIMNPDDPVTHFPPARASGKRYKHWGMGIEVSADGQFVPRHLGHTSLWTYLSPKIYFKFHGGGEYKKSFERLRSSPCFGSGDDVTSTSRLLRNLAVGGSSPSCPSKQQASVLPLGSAAFELFRLDLLHLPGHCNLLGAASTSSSVLQTTACAEKTTEWNDRLVLRSLVPAFKVSKATDGSRGPEYCPTVKYNSAVDRAVRHILSTTYSGADASVLWPATTPSPTETPSDVINPTWEYAWQRHGLCTGMAQGEYQMFALAMAHNVSIGLQKSSAWNKALGAVDKTISVADLRATLRGIVEAIAGTSNLSSLEVGSVQLLCSSPDTSNQLVGVSLCYDANRHAIDSKTGEPWGVSFTPSVTEPRACPDLPVSAATSSMNGVKLCSEMKDIHLSSF